jgi:hypothetical protein
MAKQRRKASPALTTQLRKEAGDKCANPGCTHWRTDIHHIKPWAVFQTHDAKHMIAICPSCHREVHHGRLEITDEIVRQWKIIIRPSRPDSYQLFAEPGPNPRVLLGAFCVQSNRGGATVFDLSNNNALSFRVLDGDALQVSLRLKKLSGTEVLHVTDNLVRVPAADGVNFEGPRDGKVLVTVPATEEFIPPWAITGMWNAEPKYADSGRVVALDIEVLKRGLIKVQGFWATESETIVITQDQFCVCTRHGKYPLIVYGGGENSVFVHGGPVSKAMFMAAASHHVMRTP